MLYYSSLQLEIQEEKKKAYNTDSCTEAIKSSERLQTNLKPLNVLLELGQKTDFVKCFIKG